jgi:Tol biopolymer transport system component
MTEIPGEFPLSEEAAQRQRSLLGGHIEAGRRSARTTRRGLVAVAVVILVGGLLVTPALGIGSRILDLIESSPGRPDVQAPVWSPDGRRIAFFNKRDGGKEIYVVSADGSGQRRLTGDARNAATPAWSPDGRKIVFEGDGSGQYACCGVYVVNADGSGQRRLARNGRAPAWSPDGRTIAFFSDSKIYLMNADGSEHRPLTRPLTAGKRSLAWSPDGRKLAFLNDEDCQHQFCFNLYVVGSDGSGLRNLTSKLAAARSGFGAGPPASDPAWSPDGRKLAFVRLNAGHGVYVAKADGSGLRNLTPKPVGAAYADPAWSPDGRKLAFVSDRDGNSEVYVMNANGSGQWSLTRNPAFDADPAWSPNGRKIAFVSNRDGGFAIYVMNADGSGQRRLAQHSP